MQAVLEELESLAREWAEMTEEERSKYARAETRSSGNAKATKRKVKAAPPPPDDQDNT
jgi:hypothetical protein